MISQKVLKYLRSTTGNVNFWSSARFSCGSSTEDFVSVPKSWWKKVLSWLNFAAHFSYSIFCIVRYIHFGYLQEGYETADPRMKVFIEFCSIFHLAQILSVHSLVVGQEEEVATLFNQLVFYYGNATTGSIYNFVAIDNGHFCNLVRVLM